MSQEFDLGSVIGPQGVKGDTGPQGPQGPKGDTGEQGPAGAGPSNLVNGEGNLAVKVNSTYSSANGSDSIAMGVECHADGDHSFAMGYHCNTSETSTAAIGRECTASGPWTIALGFKCYTNAASMVVVGRNNNTSSAGGIFVVGNGPFGGIDAEKSNAFRVASDGNVYAQGNFNTSGADYAEWFEWADGNPSGEDRVGYFVTLDGEKMALCGPEDDVLGIVSGMAGVIGDSYEEDWHGRFVTDAFGRRLLEDRTIPEEVDETGAVVMPARTERWFVVNPEWDAEEPYVPRSERSEWDVVGLVGKLYVRDDGSAVAGGYVKPGAGGIATAATERTRWRVLARTGENIVRVMMR